MRREPNNKPYTIDRIYPLFFWHKCDICKAEFKKEYGWKIHYSVASRIICSKCATYLFDVEKLALTWGIYRCDKPSIRPKVWKE